MIDPYHISLEKVGVGCHKCDNSSRHHLRTDSILIKYITPFIRSDIKQVLLSLGAEAKDYVTECDTSLFATSFQFENVTMDQRTSKTKHGCCNNPYSAQSDRCAKISSLEHDSLK